MSSGSGPSQTKSASQPSISSPLADAPRFSPPRSPNTSPLRRPLHERSHSQTNQYSGPTIRIVDDPGHHVYDKTPFPSQPSQILPPRNAPGYAFERGGRGVSESSSVANAVAKIEANRALVPKPLQHKKALRHSSSTSTSEADTVVASSFSPSSSRFSQGSTPPSSPSPDLWQRDKALEILEEVPSPPPKSTIRTVPPSSSSSSGGDTEQEHALTPRASAAWLASTDSVDFITDRKASLASTDSDDSIPHRSSTHTRESSSISRPLLSSHRKTLSSGSDKKQASSNRTAPLRPTLKTSTESFTYSETSFSTQRPRSSTEPSPTIHEAHTATVASGFQVHYPVVRAPSSNSLWAESQSLPSITSRMNNRPDQVHHWSSQLSTIASESERSRSIDRPSRSFSGRSQSQDEHAGNGRTHIPRRRQTVGSVSSDNASSEESSVQVPLPLFSPITRPSNGDTDSDEFDDTISPLQSPPIRKQRSGYLRKYDTDTRSVVSTNSSRPGSAHSDLSTFIANTIPAWARVYYRRGERASLGIQETSADSSDSPRLPSSQGGRTNTPSEGNFPLSIYRPRNRPHERMSHPETISISENGIMEHEVYVVGPPRRFISDQFTPRLRQDRRSQARLSAWKAPSFDDTLATMILSRQNRQILLFCLGFIFPPAWMIAAFLSLPPNPEMAENVEVSCSQMDLEHQLARELGPVDDRSYKKAMWWRNLNRIMSGIGTLLIGVIIALAILASKMS